mmetsp:Transcript_29678/g.64791  ORF Transcript_29678/g.64791 Transcript_29678/m.64791 type:complete len:320 (+) Transcript_29678:521-1480(+)
MRTNASLTAALSLSSMVKHSRLQSSADPSRRSCRQMVVPLCSFHFHTSSRKASRPRVWRVIWRSFMIFFSTTVCVAMPAWSVPGTHSVSYPLIFFQRTMVSCTELVSACPRWRVPVTLGGGITITNLGLVEPFCALKNPLFSHHWYHDASTTFGWYSLSISMSTLFLSPSGILEMASSAAASSASFSAAAAAFLAASAAFLELPSPALPPAALAAAASFWALALASALAFLASFSAFLAAAFASFAASASASSSLFFGITSASTAATVASACTASSQRLRCAYLPPEVIACLKLSGRPHATYTSARESLAPTRNVSVSR